MEEHKISDEGQKNSYLLHQEADENTDCWKTNCEPVRVLWNSEEKFAAAVREQKADGDRANRIVCYYNLRKCKKKRKTEKICLNFISKLY